MIFTNQNNPLLSKVISFATSQNLIIPGDKIIAAVSGGMDSMVMLHCLNTIKDQLKFGLLAIHVNHGIRPIDSDLDEELVRQTCQEFNIPLSVEQLKGFDYSTNEDELRRARYSAFQKVADQYPDAKIATAHHLNDQLETFLMRLAKGASLRGLRGIPVQRDIFIRPFLILTKEEIRKFSAEQNITFREDHTNQDISKLRNSIRHKIVPKLLEVFGETFYHGFENSIDEIQKIYGIYQNLEVKLFNEIIRMNGDDLSIEMKSYNDFPDKQRQHLVEYCISTYYKLNFRVFRKQYNEFDSFVARAATGSSFYFEKNICVIKERDNLIFTKGVPRQTEELELFPEQEVYIGRNNIILKEVTYKQIQFTDNKHIEYICGDRIKFPLKVRFWKHGDYFYPLGLSAKQKLSDFFINQKLGISQKYKIPLILNGTEIIWIVGFRIDNRYKISKKCKKFYKIQYYEKRVIANG